MTVAKATYRPRRKRSADATKLPEKLEAWFSGQRKGPPWCALLPGKDDGDLLAERWAHWCKKHPNAVAPEALESLIKFHDARSRFLASGRGESNGRAD